MFIVLRFLFDLFGFISKLLCLLGLSILNSDQNPVQFFVLAREQFVSLVKNYVLEAVGFEGSRLDELVYFPNSAHDEIGA